MGVTQVEQTFTTFKVPSPEKLPEDTQLIILDHPLGNETLDEEPSEEKAGEDAA